LTEVNPTAGETRVAGRRDEMPALQVTGQLEKAALIILARDVGRRDVTAGNPALIILARAAARKGVNRAPQATPRAPIFLEKVVGRKAENPI